MMKSKPLMENTRDHLPNYPRQTRNLSELFIRKMPLWKRLMDMLISGSFLVLLSPLFLIISLTIIGTSRGPVFYRQKRIGLNGRPFTVIKFRSMKADAESLQKELQQYNERVGPAFKMSDDPRLTVVGRIIRKFSLDELPQFWNVLIGDMSLVGPRPLPTDEENKALPWQKARRMVKPGITCLWQIHSRYNANFDNWIRLDIFYSRYFSFWLDIKILLLTLPAVLSCRDLPVEWTSYELVPNFKQTTIGSGNDK